MDEEHTVYSLALDREGNVTRADIQHVTNTTPVLPEGHLLVSKSIYEAVVSGMENYERFLYVGGDLVSQSPDIPRLKRRAAFDIRRAGREASERLRFRAKSEMEYEFSVSATFIGRLNLAITIDTTFNAETSTGENITLSPATARLLAKQYLSKTSQVAEAVSSGLLRLDHLQTSDEVISHTAKLCTRIGDI